MAGRIEHTLLGVTATDADVERLCREALEHRFRGVCCLPRDVSRCRVLLAGSGVLVVTVLDFPLAGGTPTEAATECARVLEAGADEVDMVVDVRALLQGELAAARDGVARVVAAAGSHPVKVILETGALDPLQIVDGCAAAEAGGASFVKTSTGFGPRGASVDDIRTMRACVGDRLGVKASGGIRTRDDAEQMVAAGADVLGTSSGPACAG
jgi:deoxyribose-phosphate aldolase